MADNNFLKASNGSYLYIQSGGLNKFLNIEIPPLTELCLTAAEAGSTVELIKVGSPYLANFAYSYDRTTWTSFEPSTTAGTNVVTLANIGDKVYFRGRMYYGSDTSNYITFVMTGLIKASGNINSLLVLSDFNELTTLPRPIPKLFYNCTSLLTAPELTATDLHSCYSAYAYMFYGCTSLTTGPGILPATTLSNMCYTRMFYGCTSLTKAPILPATDLYSNSYTYMFYGCTSLTTPPALPATSGSGNRNYQYMFCNCVSLTSVPKLPLAEIKEECYSYMFDGCTSLYISDTQTAEAPYQWNIPTNAEPYGRYYHYNMFRGCLGTRAHDYMYSNNKNTYYTQNEPI